MNDLCVSKRRNQAQTIALELKVCEGCGALWLRAAGLGVYCRHCAESLADMPLQRPQAKRGRRRKRHGSGPGRQRPGSQQLGPVLVEHGGGAR